MKSSGSWGKVVGAALLFAALTACGGGGGGGGSSSGGGGGAGQEPVATPPVVVALTVSVSVNGMAVAADGHGQYAAKPGDTIEIVSSQSAAWTSASAPVGAVTLRNAAVAPAKWSAQVVNGTSAFATFTVSAKATADASLTKDTVFAVRPADVRNAEYRVFASNGSKQVLVLNFDTMTYEMTDDANVMVADTFAPDAANPGAYLFNSARMTTPVNNARFRFTDNTVVGSFPFEKTSSVPTAYVVQPFVASNALVTKQSDLDGIYNRLGINLSSSPDSNIRASQITANGTRYLLCNEVAITSIANCPNSSLLTYAVTPEPANYLWRITNMANPADTGTFSIARIGGQNVYLSAGLVQQPSGAFRVFRIGVEESLTLPRATARGGDNLGASGSFTLDATTYSKRDINPDGSPANADYLVSSIGPLGIWAVNATGANRYFAIHSGKLTAVVGARGPIAGYLQLGLVD